MQCYCRACRKAVDVLKRVVAMGAYGLSVVLICALCGAQLAAGHDDLPHEFISGIPVTGASVVTTSGTVGSPGSGFTR